MHELNELVQVGLIFDLTAAAKTPLSLPPKPRLLQFNGGVLRLLGRFGHVQMAVVGVVDLLPLLYIFSDYLQELKLLNVFKQGVVRTICLNYRIDAFTGCRPHI